MNKLNKISFTSLCASAALMASMSTSAESLDWYGSASIGTTTVNTGITNTTGTASLDESGSGFKLLLGKKIDKTISIEGFYVDFGEASLTGNNGDTFDANNTTWVFNTNNSSVKSSATGVGANAKFNYDFNKKSSIAGRIGVMNWNVKTTVSGASISSSSLSESGTDLFYGVGYKYQFSDNYALVADYDIYKVDSENLNMMSVGMVVNF